MTDRSEDKLSGKVGYYLDQELEKLDDSTCFRLRQARLAALGHMGKKPVNWWIPAGVLATAAGALLLMVTMQNRIPDSGGQLANMEDIELLSSRADLELLADMDFYQWLQNIDRSG